MSHTSARSIINLSITSLSVSESTDPQTDSLRRRENVSGLRARKNGYTHTDGRRRTVEMEIERKKMHLMRVRVREL